jgi:hypothetical protein
MRSALRLQAIAIIVGDRSTAVMWPPLNRSGFRVREPVLPSELGDRHAVRLA